MATRGSFLLLGNKFGNHWSSIYHSIVSGLKQGQSLVERILFFEYIVKFISTKPWKVRNADYLYFLIYDYCWDWRHSIEFHLFWAFRWIYIVHFKFTRSAFTNLYYSDCIFAQETFACKNWDFMRILLGRIQFDHLRVYLSKYSAGPWILKRIDVSFQMKWKKTPERRSLSSDAIVFYQEKWNGTPIIFSHGIPTDYRIWSEQISFFPTNFRAISCSRHASPNKNAELKIDDSTVANNSKDLVSLIHELNIEHVNLVTTLTSLILRCQSF